MDDHSSRCLELVVLNNQGTVCRQKSQLVASFGLTLTSEGTLHGLNSMHERVVESTTTVVTPGEILASYQTIRRLLNASVVQVLQVQTNGFDADEVSHRLVLS